MIILVEETHVITIITIQSITATVIQSNICYFKQTVNYPNCKDDNYD